MNKALSKNLFSSLAFGGMTLKVALLRNISLIIIAIIAIS